jgi:hypothetical protein
MAKTLVKTGQNSLAVPEFNARLLPGQSDGALGSERPMDASPKSDFWKFARISTKCMIASWRNGAKIGKNHPTCPNDQTKVVAASKLASAS